jgi:hypothetical protein
MKINTTVYTETADPCPHATIKSLKASSNKPIDVRYAIDLAKEVTFKFYAHIQTVSSSEVLKCEVFTSTL